MNDTFRFYLNNPETSHTKKASLSFTKIGIVIRNQPRDGRGHQEMGKEIQRKWPVFAYYLLFLYRAMNVSSALKAVTNGQGFFSLSLFRLLTPSWNKCSEMSAGR